MFVDKRLSGEALPGNGTYILFTLLGVATSVFPLVVLDYQSQHLWTESGPHPSQLLASLVNSLCITRKNDKQSLIIRIVRNFPF